MTEHVLVTGGTGFVGAHIILQLLQKGYHVKTTLRSIRSKDAALIQKEYPDLGKKISPKKIPKQSIFLAALWSRHAREGALLLRMSLNVENEKAKSVLGWKPIANNKEVVLASIHSMIQYNLIK